MHQVLFHEAGYEVVAMVITGMAAQLGCVQNAGQGCLLPTRLLVEDLVYDAVIERILAHVATVRQCNPLDPTTTMGPVISAR